MKNLKIRNKILVSILFIICLFLFKNINQVKAATAPTYRWPIGGNNANETYMDYEYYGVAGQAPVKNGKSGREYVVNNKLWPNEQFYYAACESHHGMDITGINGHTYKVVSVVNGTVIATSAEYGGNPSTNYADRNQRRTTAGLNDGGGYGNYIVIQETSTGRCFLYGHLKGGSFKVSTGSKVSVGQEIATMGSSGDSGHMHLHFEIRKSKAVTINTAWGAGYHRLIPTNSATNLDPKDYIGSTPKYVKQITITKPTKTQYIQGTENLNLSGAKLTIRYTSEVQTTISLPNNNVKVTGFNNSKPGKNTITVEYEGCKTTFDVEIISKQLTGITVTAPTKTQYIQGKEELVLQGAKVTANYSNGDTSTIDLPNDKVKVSGFDNTKPGKDTITVEYEGKTATFDVEIKYIPAKRSKVTFQRYYRYRQINIYFDKPVVLSAEEPTVTVRVQNEIKTAEYIGMSDDGMKLMYKINNNDFDIFTEGTMFVDCTGVVLDKGDINIEVNCKFKNLTIGKLYKCELKHTFSAIINNGKGDVNGDGMIDASDASRVLRIYSRIMGNEEFDEIDKKYFDRADVNENGTVDAVDASIILSYYANKSSGITLEDDKRVLKCDMDSDQHVDIDDFNLLKSNIQSGNYNEKFDLNEDGKLDNDDIEYFRNVMYDLGSRKRD